MPAPDNIIPLGTTASFYDWFTSYNTSAVGKLNKMYVYDAKAGDGIGITFNPTTGGYTFSIASEISSGITFNGNIKFKGTVSLLSNVEVPNVSQSFAGNYTTISGFTVGSVVRITSTGGLTLASSNTREDAEAIGVVLNAGTSSSLVATFGKISGSTLVSNLVADVSGVFSTGCVYFLAENAKPGKVTVTEPTTSGLVSKPMVIATGIYEGILLPFRGQYIDIAGLSGASGGGFNTIVLPIITNVGETEANFKLRPGSIVAVSSTPKGDSYRSIGSNLYFYKANSTNSPSDMMGIVTNYVGTYAAGSTAYISLEPTGSLVEFSDLGWSTSLKDQGFIYIDSSGNPTATQSSNAFVGIAALNNFLFYPYRQTTTSLMASSTSTSETPVNVLVNGSLSIWQRKNRGDVTGVTWTSGITGGYFADRWCVLNENPNGQTFEIVRKNFNPSQTDVLGYPEYYFNFSGVTVGANNSFAIENRTEDARTNAGKEMIFSFYARNSSGATSQNFSPYVKQLRYSSDATAITYSNDIAITSPSWQRYTTSFTIPVPTGNTFDKNGYFAVGLRSKNSSLNADFAQFMLEESATESTPQIANIDEEYKKCSYYYQRSYGPKDITGSITVWTGQTLTSPVFMNSVAKCAEVNVTDLVNTNYQIQLPYRMRPSSNFEYYTSNTIPSISSSYAGIKFYSPYNGIENDAYNMTAGLNMSSTQGTVSKNLLEMFSAFGLDTSNATVPPASSYTTRTYYGGTLSPPITLTPIPNVDTSVNSIVVRLNQGYALFDRLAFHYEIDLDLNQGF